MASPVRTVQGTCDERFIAVKNKLQEFLDSGRELGASICVNLNGTNLIDIWGGHADAAQTRPWEENTITTVWSTTKNVTSLATLLLIDRGVLDPNAPVCKYWPEFSTNGKESVLVRHLLSHSSGVSGWDAPITPEQILDIPYSTKLLEQQAPFWPPGTASGYHAMNMGHLLGELISRVTGQPLGHFIESELAHPLGADFQLGARKSDWPRIAEITPPPPPPAPPVDLDPTSPMVKTLMNPPLDARIANSETWRNIDLGAANGHSNARGVCRILSTISLNGSVDGKTLLSPATIARIFETQATGVDLVLGKTARFGLGYAIPSPAGEDAVELPNWVPSGQVATWGGWGGSMAVMDVDRGLTIAYVMNRMENNFVSEEEKARGVRERLREYICGVYEGLGVTVPK